jgi:hypothetical protein
MFTECFETAGGNLLKTNAASEFVFSFEVALHICVIKSQKDALFFLDLFQ